MYNFDQSTLDEVAYLVCGDDGPYYRAAWEIREFFRRAEISDSSDEGPTRRIWVRRVLEENDESLTNAERVILRLADPREFQTEKKAYQETLRQLGDILRLEGLQIEQDQHGRPTLADYVEKPSVGIELRVTMSEVVADPELAAITQQRLNEARLCHENGAYMATIIMLGSLLEGVLSAAADERLVSKPSKSVDRMGLQELINLAHDEGWIQMDVHKGSDLIRSYRNLVHPRAQIRMHHAPDSDTVDICWPVVNATLNDLAASSGRLK